MADLVDGLKKRAFPHLAAFLTSNRLRDARRIAASLGWRLRMQRPALRVFLRVGDPYSHLLVQVLDELASNFNVRLELHGVEELPAEMTPEPERQRSWAHQDGADLAALYGLLPPGPARSVSDERAGALLLAEAEGLAAARDVFERFAAGDPMPAPRDDASAAARLRSSERRLERDGHYLSAMVRFGAEWYWGIDRLNHLCDRLIGGDLDRATEPRPRRFRERLAHLASPARRLDSAPPLILYWSARSPYSYLVLDRASELASAFGVELELRVVLPMVMRDLPVPRRKRLYLLLDAKREADLLGLPFGRVCDPLGVAVERCYSVMDQLDSSAQVFAWARAFAGAVWSEGIDAANDDGIRAIAEAAGLDAAECLAKASGNGWREAAEKNRRELLDGGLWGVPTLRFGETWAWGQDRLWVIEAAMRQWS